MDTDISDKKKIDIEVKNDSQSDLSARKRHTREKMIWLLISFLFLIPVLLDLAAIAYENAFGIDKVEIGRVLPRYSENFFLALIVIFFPAIYKLIFENYPLESFRQWKIDHAELGSDGQVSLNHNKKNMTQQITASQDLLSLEELSSFTAIKLFAYYASSSRRLSLSIYNRAGVYLMTGVIVAFSGVFFFYSQTTSQYTSAQNYYYGNTNSPRAADRSQSANENNADHYWLIPLVTKFGVLLFIEMIAFFFLRQYRSAMDEFRYYEAIKRKREETLALIRITADNEKPIDPIELVKNESFFSKSEVITKDQTTEILESRKLEKNELDLLEKVIDVISRSK